MDFVIEPRGPFSLAAAATFWGGFTPATHPGATDAGHLHVAFAVERSWAAAGMCVREQPDGTIAGSVSGTGEPAAVRTQVERVLSLDIDGSGFDRLEDPVVKRLQARFSGLRPVCFYSPYEAACWAIISNRIRMTQAAKVRKAITEQFGTVVDIHGDQMPAFPAPEQLLRLTEFPGLFGRKVEYLHGVARAALNGRLDAARLRSMPDEQALADLRQLGGIGPFASELILLRGCGHPDYVSLLEPRLRRAIGRAYGLGHQPTDEDVRRIADGWRPFRMWVSLLLRYADGRLEGALTEPLPLRQERDRLR
ncbi:MAG: DNA-3-methyladenine glycosylase 2 family protein [Chloroflexi bacterium]|nr:DNA-3-methyladenine glycosylase 2 family protein [Chloroflexota bacterium]